MAKTSPTAARPLARLDGYAAVYLGCPSCGSDRNAQGCVGYSGSLLITADDLREKPTVICLDCDGSFTVPSSVRKALGL